MMRSLWTAASGMISQQMNVDVIANNLANVNTAGFKKERMEFKTLLYETMQRADLDQANQTGRPVNLQVGHGVRPVAVTRILTMGNMQRTDAPLDFTIHGDGYFVVRHNLDEIKYTRDGTLKLLPTDNGLVLSTSEGYAILGDDDAPIVFPSDIIVRNVVVDETGRFFYTDGNNVVVDLGLSPIQLVQFPNPQGLANSGQNLLQETPASGAPIRESDGEVAQRSRLIQGDIEMSNVQVADEMVSLIVAQRAYDLNSKAITTSDDMLQTANNLKRG